MNSQHPDRDSLSAFLEEALSIDASQWIEHHLEGCSECRVKIEEERAFLGELSSLHTIDPPTDFVEGVMARVAQYPAYQPAPEVTWRRAGVWSSAAAAVIVTVLAIAGWALVSQMINAPIESPQAAGAAGSAITTLAGWSRAAYFMMRDFFAGLYQLLLIALALAFGVVGLIRSAGLMLQLGLLLAMVLATVGFNYVFSRMVLNYQRRQ